MNTTAAAFAATEPPDGTTLITERAGVFHVIQRDDKAAARWHTPAVGPWFDVYTDCEDPLPLAEHLQYADAVYALGDKLAEFRQ